MVTFLFWNLYRKDLRHSLRRLATLYDVDIFIFAECNSIAAILLGLNPEGSSAKYRYATGENDSDRIQIFTRFPAPFFETVRNGSRYTIRRLRLPRKPDILIAAAHLLSSLHADKMSQFVGAQRFAESIRIVEDKVEHSRTVVVGDLNLNPFDEGVAGASSLHGVMTKRIAQKEQRTVQGQISPMLYNPMWSRYGDHPARPPGTYYYAKSNETCHFWNIYDQVLIRPSLLPYWNDDYLQVLTDDGELSFLTNAGLPDATVVSDHFPLLFRLNL